MPVFPGAQQPVFEQTNGLETDGFIETKISLFSHTGTHIDAPGHILEEGITLDKYDINCFLGNAIILNFSAKNNCNIELNELKIYEDKIKDVDFIILRTGWDKYWESPNYFMGYPTLSEKAARWLTNFNLKGICVDAISLDDINSSKFPIHHIFLENHMMIIENLTNLIAVNFEPFVFSCLPLKIKNIDGFPIRAVAFKM